MKPPSKQITRYFGSLGLSDSVRPSWEPRMLQPGRSWLQDGREKAGLVLVTFRWGPGVSSNIYILFMYMRIYIYIRVYIHIHIVSYVYVCVCVCLWVGYK